VIGKKVKKSVLIGLAALVVITLMAGCSNKGNNPSEEGVNSSTKQATWGDAPQVKMAVADWGNFSEAFSKTGDDPVDNPYTRYIFEKTGVRLVPVLYPGSEFKQKLAVEITGNTKIDLINYWDLQQEWMQNGSIITINELLNKYKNSTPNIQQNIPNDAWAGLTKKNDVWGFPVRPALGHPDIYYVFVRKDWLDTLHLEMPKSTDDLTNILKAFTEEDPDKNQKKDTFGLTVGKNFGGTNTWMFFWGVDIWSDGYVDGKLTSQAETPQARAGYEKIAQWFKNGYVNQEGLTDDNIGPKLLVNNKAGVFIGSGPQMIQYSQDLQKNGFENANWSIVPNQIVSSFDTKFYGWPRQDNKSGAIMITSVSNKQDAIMKLMEWMYSEEGTRFQELGLPGREYNIVDGKNVKDMKYDQDHKSYLGLFNLGKSYNHVTKQITLDNWNNTELAKQIVEATEKYDNFTTPFLRVVFNYPDSAAWKEFPDYRKAVDVYGAKFWLGQLDASKDNDWQAFIKENDKYGMHKLYAEIEEEFKEDQAAGK